MSQLVATQLAPTRYMPPPLFVPAVFPVMRHWSKVPAFTYTPPPRPALLSVENVYPLEMVNPSTTAL